MPGLFESAKGSLGSDDVIAVDPVNNNNKKRMLFIFKNWIQITVVKVVTNK